MLPVLAFRVSVWGVAVPATWVIRAVLSVVAWCARGDAGGGIGRGGVTVRRHRIPPGGAAMLATPLPRLRQLARRFLAAARARVAGWTRVLCRNVVHSH